MNAFNVDLIFQLLIFFLALKLLDLLEQKYKYWRRIWSVDLIFFFQKDKEREREGLPAMSPKAVGDGGGRYSYIHVCVCVCVVATLEHPLSHL